jgi:hypothetical protein
VGTVTVGVDIGQKRDPTAIAVAELEHRERAETGRREDHWLVRHLERLPLGTPYPGVADRLAVVVEGVRKRTGHAPACYLDATGVGQPVADEMTSRGLAVTACYFTHGDRRTEEGTRVTIGKAWLVSRLQALLQGGRLHLPDTSEARVLADELLDYEIRVEEDANDRYGAFRVGKHERPRDRARPGRANRTVHRPHRTGLTERRETIARHLAKRSRRTRALPRGSADKLPIS